MEQRYTSKDTSINVINKVYKNYPFIPNTTVFDYGGGKYNTNIEYMKEQNVKVLVYDLFNRTKDHNDMVLIEAKKQHIDYAVCSNVLNVIYENEIIKKIIKDLYDLNADLTLITIYEGNKTNEGKETSKGYQRNEVTSRYFEVIEEYFDIIRKKNKILVCRRKSQ